MKYKTTNVLRDEKQTPCYEGTGFFHDGIAQVKVGLDFYKEFTFIEP